MDHDHIDPSHWLTKGSEVIKPERKAAKNVVAEGDGSSRRYRSLTDPLDFYVYKGLISERQYDAGERLRVLWVKGSQSPYSQSRYGEQGSGGFRQDYLPIGIFAVEYRDALYTIRGDPERKVAYMVCCENVAASRCLDFKSRRTAQRHGMHHLKSALDDLAGHFKIEVRKSR